MDPGDVVSGFSNVLSGIMALRNLRQGQNAGPVIKPEPKSIGRQALEVLFPPDKPTLHQSGEYKLPTAINNPILAYQAEIDKGAARDPYASFYAQNIAPYAAAAAAMFHTDDPLLGLGTTGPKSFNGVPQLISKESTLGDHLLKASRLSEEAPALKEVISRPGIPAAALFPHGSPQNPILGTVTKSKSPLIDAAILASAPRTFYDKAMQSFMDSAEADIAAGTGPSIRTDAANQRLRKIEQILSDREPLSQPEQATQFNKLANKLVEVTNKVQPSVTNTFAEPTFFKPNTISPLARIALGFTQQRRPFTSALATTILHKAGKMRPGLLGSYDEGPPPVVNMNTARRSGHSQQDMLDSFIQTLFHEYDHAASQVEALDNAPYTTFPIYDSSHGRINSEYIGSKVRSDELTRVHENLDRLGIQDPSKRNAFINWYEKNKFKVYQNQGEEEMANFGGASGGRELRDIITEGSGRGYKGTLDASKPLTSSDDALYQKLLKEGLVTDFGKEVMQHEKMRNLYISSLNDVLRIQDVLDPRASVLHPQLTGRYDTLLQTRRLSGKLAPSSTSLYEPIEHLFNIVSDRHQAKYGYIPRIPD